MQPDAKLTQQEVDILYTLFEGKEIEDIVTVLIVYLTAKIDEKTDFNELIYYNTWMKELEQAQINTIGAFSEIPEGTRKTLPESLSR